MSSTIYAPKAVRDYPYPVMKAAARKKAVEIAKDAIKQLNAKKFIATTGCYSSVSNLDDYGKKQDFKKVFLKDKEAFCNVCAIGALTIAKFTRYNNATVAKVEDIYDGAAHVAALEGIFDPNHLRLMEWLFEGCIIGNGYWDYLIGNGYALIKNGYGGGKYKTFNQKGRELDDYINDLRWKYEDADDSLLRYILNNIIRNDGIFKFPSKIEF